MSIRITARPEQGIRRVGVHHPAAPVVFPDEYFETHEVEILKRDPDLIVELLDDEFLSPGERHHLHLLPSEPSDTTGADVERNAQPDAGHALASTPSHGPSAEQSAAEGEGRENEGEREDDEQDATQAIAEDTAVEGDRPAKKRGGKK